MADDRQLIDEQIAYYSKRAPEYDETSIPWAGPLADQGLRLVRALAAFEPRGKVLELACGTGVWTELLLRYAREITAVDASAEMLALNRRRVRSDRVRYLRADLFEWRPDATYDVVFFSFWLSHVPPTRFERFWKLVASSLPPRGRVFFMDEAAHDFWREQPLDDRIAPLVRRRLRDGSEHRVIKVFWRADELESRLNALGWDITVHSTGAFYWGEGHARRSGPLREA